jgi:DNA-binding response OmpR family regulator/REP element-mobilizing transposase RayT
VHKSILVTSPHRAFAELLRSSLEESGRYYVRMVHTARETLEAAEGVIFDLVILDADVEDEAVVSVGKRLMERHPNMLLMVIPPDNDPTHLSLVNFTPHSYLERPFYLPDLLTRLDRLLGDGQPAEPSGLVTRQTEHSPDAGGLTGWLRDEQQITYDLEVLLRETYFTHALLAQAGQVMGTSIQFDLQDARKTAEWIERYWDQSSDMARYIRLDVRGGEHLLYVTRLSGVLALATVSDITLPLSQVRSRSRTLAKALVEMIAEREQEFAEQRRLNEVVAQRVHPVAVPAAAEGVDHRVEPEGGVDDDEDEETERDLVIKLSDLLDGMPSPDPGEIFTRSEWEAVSPGDAPESAKARQAPESKTPGLVLPWEEDEVDDHWMASPAAPDPVSDTRPAHPGEDWQEDTEVTLPVFAQISFTCILIPAHAYHHLVGDLAKSLSHWLPQTCLGFGWQVQNMHIEPEYLLWVVNVTPTVSPGNVVRKVRKHTSEQIFAQFPDLLEKNMNGDFWAPGYLVISGSQPPTEQLVSDFITQTRRRQGII